jgi:hypothetical protein
VETCGATFQLPKLVGVEIARLLTQWANKIPLDGAFFQIKELSFSGKSGA